MFQRLPGSTRSTDVKVKRLRLRVVSEKSCKYKRISKFNFLIIILLIINVENGKNEDSPLMNNKRDVFIPSNFNSVL